MNESSQHHSEQEPQAPPGLIAALKKAPQEKIFVPPHVDAFVLKAAREHLEGARKPRHSVFRSWRFWPALATACLLIAGLVHLAIRPTVYAREDINHDGRVDILDSFALARDIKSGDRLSPALDINGDGVVDERDVQSLAARAVKLDKSKSS